MPDAAVFADTQAEPMAVYEWLAWLEKQLPFPVYRVTGGNLETDTVKSMERKRIANPPFFTAPMVVHKAYHGGRMPAPFHTIHNGKGGQLRRMCTREYKIDPINKFVRNFIGLRPRQRVKEPMVTRWIGISLDESHRSKLSEHSWAINRHPLIELSMTREHCLRWMEAKGYPRPAKSACYFCPYHDDGMWRDLRDNHPQDWERAIQFDEAIRHNTVRGVKSPVFLHRSRQPLKDVDLRTAEDFGQTRLFDEQGFAVECEGMCGL